MDGLKKGVKGLRRRVIFAHDEHIQGSFRARLDADLEKMFIVYYGAVLEEIWSVELGIRFRSYSAIQ
jgi:hypothetical protein